MNLPQLIERYGEDLLGANRIESKYDNKGNIIEYKETYNTNKGLEIAIEKYSFIHLNDII